jgi:hypothetical protein
VLCAVGRGALEGWCEVRSFGSLAEREDTQQRGQLKRGDEPNEVNRQEGQPGKLVRAVRIMVRDDECDQGNYDRRNRNQDPYTLLPERLHR